MPGLANSTVRIANGVPKKPKGKMPIHAFFVKIFWEGHTEKNPNSCELCIFQMLWEVKYSV